MGRRRVIVKKSAAYSIAQTAWFIESIGMVTTAEKFSDRVYDFFIRMGDTTKSYPLCRHPEKAGQVINVLLTGKNIR